MKFEFKLKDGHIVNDMDDFINLHRYYEVACSGEFIQNDIVASFNDWQALQIGYEVRRLMDKTEYPDELDTIHYVLSNVKIMVIEWLKEHEQAYRDIAAHFEVSDDPEDDAIEAITLPDIMNWIDEHKTLREDFDSYFADNSLC